MQEELFRFLRDLASAFVYLLLFVVQHGAELITDTLVVLAMLAGPTLIFILHKRGKIRR